MQETHYIYIYNSRLRKMKARKYYVFHSAQKDVIQSLQVRRQSSEREIRTEDK